MHTGRRVRLSLRPAGPDAGIVFVRTDIHDRDNRVRAHGESVVETRMETVIGNPAGVTVATIEHLVASLSALGVDNVTIELDGPETPIMDGSAQPFVQLMDGVGLRQQDAPRRYIEIVEPIEVTDGAKRAALVPADRFELSFEIDFASDAIGRGASIWSWTAAASARNWPVRAPSASSRRSRRFARPASPAAGRWRTWW